MRARLFAVRATPVVVTSAPLVHWMEVRWMLSGAEHVITVLSPWTTVIELLGVRERVRGGGGAVCVFVSVR